MHVKTADRSLRVHAIVIVILFSWDRRNIDPHSNCGPNFCSPRLKFAFLVKTIHQASVFRDQVITMRRVVSEPVYDSSILSCVSQSINTAILNCSACTFSFDLCFWLAYKIGSPVFVVEFCEQFLRLRFRSVTRQTITHPPGTRLARFRIFARCVEVTRNIAKKSSGMESHSAFYDNGTRNRVCAKDSQVGRRTFECSGSRDVSLSYTAV